MEKSLGILLGYVTLQSAHAFMLGPQKNTLLGASWNKNSQRSLSMVVESTPVANTFEETRVSVGGLSIAPLGIGTWAWGDNLFWQYSESMDSELQDVFDTCVEKGINFFDTAEVYGLGRSEYLCGKFKREFQGPNVLKNDIAIGSKFAALPWRLNRKSVVVACQASLDRMGLKSMELYQLHWPGVFKNEAYWDGIADCYDQGLIKAVGVSNYNAGILQDAYDALQLRGVPLASNQISYSLLNRKPETDGLLAKCESLGVAVLAYSPLSQGLLTGKYTPENLPVGPRNRLYKKVVPKIDPLVKILKIVGERHNKTPAQVALNWCICKGTIPIPGAKNTRQAEENAGALGWRLNAAEVSELDAVSSSLDINMTQMPMMNMKK